MGCVYKQKGLTESYLKQKIETAQTLARQLSGALGEQQEPQQGTGYLGAFLETVESQGGDSTVGSPLKQLYVLSVVRLTHFLFILPACMVCMFGA